MADEPFDYLRYYVDRTLRSKAAARIDFTLGSITVDAVGFRTVANLIQMHSVKLKVEASNDPDVEASYGNQANTLYFPNEHYGGTRKQQMYIIHECVHALHDKVGGGRIVTNRGAIWTPRSEGEAAAYVAAALFALYDNGAVYKGNAIYNAASDIAVRIWSTPGITVSTDDALTLRQAVVGHRAYAHLTLTSLTTADG